MEGDILNDLPRRALIDIIRDYGRSVLDDPRRCEALLQDRCGESRREIFLLTSTLREGAARELAAARQDVPVDVLVSQLSTRLRSNLALTDEAAQWAVESWAAALGLIADHPLGLALVRPALTPLNTPPSLLSTAPEIRQIIVSNPASPPATGPSVGDFDLKHPADDFVRVLRELVLHPVTFFDGLPSHGRLAGPLLFGTICVDFNIALQLAVDPQKVLISELGPIGTVIAYSILVPMFLAALAAIYHLFVVLFTRGKNNGFKATFRVALYTEVTALVSWIPGVGPLFNLFSLYLFVVGIRRVHRAPRIAATQP